MNPVCAAGGGVCGVVCLWIHDVLYSMSRVLVQRAAGQNGGAGCGGVGVWLAQHKT